MNKPDKAEENPGQPTWRADERSLRLHRKALVFDSLSLDYVLNEPYTSRVIEGGVNATNVTFAIEEDWQEATHKIESLLEKIDKSPRMVHVTTADQIEAAKRDGKLAIIVGAQGSTMVGRDLARLKLLHRIGMRCIQLTYTAANLYGDGCGEHRDAGVSFLGRDFIAAVNELNMWLDLSHCGHRTTLEAIELARRPVITHANAYALNPSDRNKKDETVKALAAKGSMIAVAMPPRFLRADGRATLADLVDHIDHFSQLIGPQHVGIGFDFTESLVENKVDLPEAARWRGLRPDIFGTADEFAARRNPDGIATIREAPNVTHALLARGYSEEQVFDILGQNWMRTFRNWIG